MVGEFQWCCVGVVFFIVDDDEVGEDVGFQYGFGDVYEFLWMVQVEFEVDWFVVGQFVQLGDELYQFDWCGEGVVV